VESHEPVSGTYIVNGRQHGFKTLCFATKLMYASFYIFGIVPKTKQLCIWF